MPFFISSLYMPLRVNRIYQVEKAIKALELIEERLPEVSPIINDLAKLTAALGYENNRAEKLEAFQKELFYKEMKRLQNAHSN